MEHFNALFIQQILICFRYNYWLSILFLYEYTLWKSLSFGYLLKNISLTDKKSHQLKLIEKIESVLKRMRWKVHFFLSKEHQQPQTLKTYIFKSNLITSMK